ncbi:hypothetical protein PYCCODRAFT_1405960 [Trametes coccinea BRFM310]|uniref:RING-type E3 ubiquitin transferase n=1 Tax=Trametes coccinea (strain BRFM310) TaxID=1353009 RepID=A0A1Y2IXG7_TRAC3|nr:hypothetical protein PYCCODRAFT_1405960 [Trametes coccinea BRFM310]
MQEEQDTCRICSAPAEPDQPLFHPCKCSGTIRYIHQDCLTEWLAHSKKKTCDVCKYPYSFTKVYSKDMPEKLPFFLVLRQFSQQLAFALLFGLRAVLVASIWLAALPWATIWTWRIYFAMGNHAAWWISDLKRPEHEPDLFDEVVSNTTVINATLAEQQAATPSGFLTHPRVLQVSSDIVAGQIIASMIVVAFVGIFLLREWITQNARPGVFEDGDLPIDADMLPPPPAEIAAPLPEPPDRAAAGPIHPPMLEEEFRPRHDPGLDDWGPRVRRKKPRTRGDPIQSSTGEEAPEDIPQNRHDERDTSRRKKLKRKPFRHTRSYRRDSKDGGWLSVTEGEEGEKPRRRRRRKSDHTSDSQFEAGSRQHRASEEGEQEQMPNRLNDSLPALSEFTFTVPVPSASAASDEPSSSTNGSRSPGPVGYGDPPARNPFTPPRLLYPDSSTEEDERDPTPTSPPRGPPMRRDVGVGTESMGSSSDAEGVESSRSQPISGPSNPRRPPLPSITLPPSPAGPSASTSAINSRKHTPLASPSLATYRAPEDLDADQPGNNYFGPEREWFGDLTDEELEEAQARYFRRQHERRRDIMADRQAEVEREREEMEEMADGELDAEMEDEGDDIRWTDEEIVVEDEDEDDQADQEGQAGQLGMEVNPAPGAGLAEGFNPPPPPADDLENDVNIEDDMDGALEAIGLRGPLYGVLQNAILMTFILDTTIGLGIWLPFTIGKTTALLTLNPRRAMQILHLPLRIIRLVTDPVVDTVLLVFTRLLVPPLVNLAQLVIASCFNGVTSLAGADRAEKLATIANSTYDYALKLASRFMGNATESITSSTTDSRTAPSYLHRLLQEDTMIMRVIEPYFAPLGQNVRQWSATGKETWMELATGDDRQDRIFAVLLGYAVVGILLAIYLNVLTVGTMRSAGRAVRSAIRQQLLVVKVAAFIIIELVIFPLGCGIMLDVCSVWMFPAGTFRSRAAFLLYAPLRAIFYHWVLGTMFMYQFAVLLSGCRGIMRPGAMWFIKDPQDQNFHPIRDILERPTLVQLRKLLLSAAMYGIVVASGVATISSILRLFRGTIMPFRWKIREPLSEVPIDLIFIQLVLPYTMEYFRPRKGLRRLGTFVWKYFARQLRLSSYMFGGRYPSEEYTPTTWTWRFLLTSEDDVQMDDAEAVHDGSFRRVPNSDNVALVKDAPATVDVDEEGYPLNEDGRKLIQAQNAEAERAKRSVKEDYTVVYIPPDFGYRVCAFLLLIWTVGSVLLATALAAPILLGRAFFRLFLPYDVHDGYSFIIGFYLLWGCYLVGAALDRMDKRRQRRWSDGPRAEWPLYVAKRSLLWVLQASYMAVTLGVILPTLLGLTVELYLIQPFKYALRPSVEPRIRMVDMWALGLLYAKIVIRSMQTHHPEHEIMRGIDRVIRNGWTHLDPVRATMEVVSPASASLLTMIMFPIVCVRVLARFASLPLDAHFLYLHVYPMIFTLAGLGHSVWALSKVMASWSQTIRDKEFLVEMRLRNLEEQEQDAANEEGQAR